MNNETITSPVETKRRGIIYISASVWKKTGMTCDTPDAWHKKLLLPAQYEIERVEHVNCLNSMREVFKLTVASDAIPMSDAHISQVELTPFYGLSNGTPELLRIEMKQWDGKAWNLVKTEVIKDV